MPKGEMESGIFSGIEEAIARPGEEIDQLFREYHTDRDSRFYVEYWV